MKPKTTQTTQILTLTATTLLATAAAAAADSGNPKSEIRNPQSQQPNVIILITDQQRWDALSYSGNKVIRTPNLDRLAASGAWFKNAVTPCPVCAPARTSVLTGATIEKTTVTINPDANAKNKCPYTSFDQILEASGYHSEWYGKFHSPTKLAIGYSNPDQGGLTGAALIYGDKDLYKQLTDEKVPKRALVQGEQRAPSYYRGIPYRPNPMDPSYGKPPSNAAKTKKNAKAAKQAATANDDAADDDGDGGGDNVHGCITLPADLTLTSFTAGRALAALDRMPKNQPFQLTCSIVAPHPPVLPGEPYYSQYDRAQMPLPASLGDKMENNPYRGRRRAQYSDSKTIGYFIGDYYAYVTEADLWIGKILDKVEALGLRDNTIIVFFSDHGEMLGSHGMEGKTVFLEESVRVPLIISYPGVIPAGKIIDAPVSTIDIFPTILELTNQKPTPRDGYSLMPLIRGEKPKYDFAVSEWNTKKKGSIANIMIRDNQWKLFMAYNDGEGNTDALFDLKNDPYEMNNLLGANPDKKKYKDIVAKLQTELAAYLTDITHPYAKAVSQRDLFQSTAPTSTQSGAAPARGKKGKNKTGKQ